MTHLVWNHRIKIPLEKQGKRTSVHKGIGNHFRNKDTKGKKDLLLGIFTMIFVGKIYYSLPGEKLFYFFYLCLMPKGCPSASGLNFCSRGGVTLGDTHIFDVDGFKL